MAPGVVPMPPPTVPAADQLQAEQLQRQLRRQQRQQRLLGALVPSCTKVIVCALALLQAACGVWLIVTAAQELLYSAAGPPHRRCRLGGDVTNTSACDYTIALAAVGLAGSVVTLMLLTVDYALKAAMATAEVAASEVAGPSASLGFRMYEAFSIVRFFFMGGWVAKAVLALVNIFYVAWWAAGVGTLVVSSRVADAKGLPGAEPRRRAVALAGAALAAQVAMVLLGALSACCKCCGMMRPARGGGGGGAGGAGPSSRLQQPMLPDVVLMPAYPVPPPAAAATAV